MYRPMKVIPNPHVDYLKKVVCERDRSMEVGVISTAEGCDPIFRQITNKLPGLSADELRAIADMMEE